MGSMTINRNIYQKDPATRKLVNEGVASVNDEKTSQALDVLRYELETFVCDGQYAKGMAHILEIYLKNISEAQQPAVWVSGFYGSGKSHLVKMLRALWLDTVFADGATARGIAQLPQDIQNLLKELNTQAKRHGGLHAASGTLGASAQDKSVRLALLAVVFKSIGLPEQYPVARFVIWLKKEGLFDEVKQRIEAKGISWQEELDNFHVAEELHSVLAEVKPNNFASPAACTEALNHQYPPVRDVSNEEMTKSIRQALATKDSKFPLTAIILDEIQQYIGSSAERSIAVQEAVEACCKNIGGKLLFIGTGQTAITGTANLARLQGRFTVRIELSDADVDTVIRQVILAKKPEAKAPIEKIMQTNLGEISRHLGGTTIGHRQNDLPFFTQDYPILPVRRRFWENTLRILDQTGTDSQLRNQLSMVHKAIQSNMNESLGCVVPADYLYFDSADRLLQSRILPRKVHEKTMHWIKGTEDERVVARACGLVFLLNKLGNNTEIGIHATTDTLADLLVDDLSLGSGALRGKLPELLNSCELLMKIGDEYRIQTEESAAWNDEFLSQQASLANEAHRIETERDDRLRKKFGELVGRLSLIQGNSKVSRSIFSVFDAQLPSDANQKICVWVRDGWSIDETSVIADARQAGHLSPTVFVFIPKRSADDLRRHLIDFKAASATLARRGVPNTPEGTEACAAMETTKQTAEGKIHELFDEAFSGSRVFQGGGNEILGNNLQEMVSEAASNSLQRMYPQFQMADHAGWSKVYEKAQKGAPDALKAVGDDGEPANNPVCKAILSFIAGGKKGAEIRDQFKGAGYGWSQDAVDGGLQILLVAGLLRAQDERGQTIDPKKLERKTIGKTMFKGESVVINAAQRIQIRKLLQRGGINVKPSEEMASVLQFLQKLQNLAEQAGGDAPKSVLPDTSLLEQIRLTAGGEQLLALYTHRDELLQSITVWTDLAERISKRWPEWMLLKRLVGHATGLQEAEKLLAPIKHIEQQRQLLEEPDLIAPLVAELTQLLRDELNRLDKEYEARYQQGSERLQADPNWQPLEPEQRYQLMSEQYLHEAARPMVEVQTTADVLATLDNCSLAMFADRVAAMNARFDNVATGAAELLEPEAQLVEIPRRTLRTIEDIDAWLAEVNQQLKCALEKGPIVIR